MASHRILPIRLFPVSFLVLALVSVFCPDSRVGSFHNPPTPYASHLQFASSEHFSFSFYIVRTKYVVLSPSLSTSNASSRSRLAASCLRSVQYRDATSFVLFAPCRNSTPPKLVPFSLLRRPTRLKDIQCHIKSLASIITRVDICAELLYHNF